MTGSLSYALHLSGNAHFKERPSQAGASASGLEGLQAGGLQRGAGQAGCAFSSVDHRGGRQGLVKGNDTPLTADPPTLIFYYRFPSDNLRFKLEPD